MQRPESGTTDSFTEYGDNLEQKAREESRELLFCTKGPYAVRSVTKSTVTIEKDLVAIPVSADSVTKIPQVLDETEPATGLHNTITQPHFNRQTAEEKSSRYPADVNDPERAEYVVGRVVGHRRTGVRTEYKVQWYRCSAGKDTMESASGSACEFFSAILRQHTAAP